MVNSVGEEKRGGNDNERNSKGEVVADMGRILKRVVGDNNFLDRGGPFSFLSLFFLVIYVKGNGDLPVG